MIGGIIGDIVGSVYECVNHKSKDFEFFPKYALYGVPCEIYDKAMTQQWWGGVFLLNGDKVKVTKVTLLP